MFCQNCGTKLDPGVKRCPFCGASVSGGRGPDVELPADDVSRPDSAAPVWESSAPAWETASPAYRTGPEVPKKSRRGLAIGLAAGAAVVCLALALFVFLRPKDPKTALGEAVAKSAAAYAEAAKANPLTGWRDALEDNEISESLSLEITRVGDLLNTPYLDMDFLQGMGVRLTGDLSLSARSLETSAALFYRGEDLLRAQLGIEDTLAEIYLPELMDGRSLAFDTTTLGQELARLGAEGTEELSFDFFDLLDSSELPELDGQAAKDFLDAVEVTREGKSDRQINGRGLSCENYRVFIPREALEALLRSPAADSPEYAADLEELSLDQDVELTVYVYDGYVAGVLWNGELAGEASAWKFFFGGGDSYVDDLSVEIRVADSALLLSSYGNHAGGDGVLTDSTAIRFKDGGMTVMTVASDFSYDAGAGGNNLFWTLSAADVSLSAQGRAEAGRDTLRVQLEDVSLQTYGSELAGLKGELTASPYQGAQPISGERLLLSEMTPEDLEFWADRIEANGRAWVRDLGKKIPALAILALLV